MSAVHNNGTEVLQPSASASGPRSVRGQESGEAAGRQDRDDRRGRTTPLARLIALVVLVLVAVPALGCACLTLTLVLLRLGG